MPKLVKRPRKKRAEVEDVPYYHGTQADGEIGGLYEGTSVTSSYDLADQFARQGSFFGVGELGVLLHLLGSPE